jgi:WD40-like Beta Propeller Repeat
MNAGSTNQTRLSWNAAWDGEPTFSPDGTQIACASSRDGNPDIRKMKTDGSDPTQITHDLVASQPRLAAATFTEHGRPLDEHVGRGNSGRNSCGVPRAPVVVASWPPGRSKHRTGRGPS